MTLVYQRLRAPVEDGQSLQIPAISDFVETLGDNRRRLSGHSFQLAGRSIEQLRTVARSELVELARRWSSSYRDVNVPADWASVVMSGHQPTLFHPGVWFKNVVLDHVAAKSGSVAINLVVDNDHQQLRSIRVPIGDIDQPGIDLVRFDSKNSEAPFEAEKLYDSSMFATFGDRVATTLGKFVPQPLIHQLWPHVLNALPQSKQPSIAIAAGRHRLEQDFGMNTLEVPLSSICKTESFAAFASELLMRAEEFRQVYNQTLNEYRLLHGIRSVSHPVPSLREIEGWIELPFWVWSKQATDATPSRKPLFVRKNGSGFTISDLGSDMGSVSVDLDASDLSLQVAELDSKGVCLRTRALTTTMYSRLVLSDAFLHGIGGAKYDEVTDQIVKRFFSIEPPVYHTITATHRLPILHSPTTFADVQALNIHQRSLAFHAERFVDPQNDAVAELVKQKRDLIASIPVTGSKKDWHDKVSAINTRLRGMVSDQSERVAAEIEAARHRYRASQLLGSREFSFCLFDAGLAERMKSGLK